MNDNPGETPNPLNAGQGTASAPQPSPTQPTQPAQPTQTIQDVQPASPAPATTPVADVDGGPLVESLDPTGRPMQKAAEATEAPKKKKKVGLIVGIVIAAVVLIGGGVAAALIMMNMNKTDAVTAAMNKLMSGDGPENVVADGTIDILPNDANSPISRVSIALNSGIILGSNINTSSAVVTIVDSSDNNYSMEFNEVYAANGDLYLKLDGVTAALEDLEKLVASQSYPLENPYLLEDCATDDTDCIELRDTKCAEDENGEMVCDVADITNVTDVEGIDIDEDLMSDSALFDGDLLSVVETIDGEWIKISTEEMGLLTDGLTSQSSFSCISNLVNDINKNSNSAIELYNKYPFYSSTNENLVVTSKNNPIYKLEIDADNFANFVNSINNSILSSDIYTCLNLDDNVSITSEDVADIIKQLPEMYVEVDANYNFTRFYANTETEEGAEVIMDFSFTYPSNINVSEPLEYVDFMDVMQEIMLSMFDLPTAEIDEETVVVGE